MKSFMWTALAFVAGFFVISSIRSAPSVSHNRFPGGLDAYYTGCELPGAIPDCQSIMENAPIHQWASQVVALNRMPSGGPTPDMKVAILQEQDAQLEHYRLEEPLRRAAEAQEKANSKAEIRNQEELKRRAGVQ
jgi:hypothetical protein